METTYLICALVGGTVIVCQFLLTLLGVGGEHGDGDIGIDVHDGDHAAGHHDHGTNWLFGVLTFRALVAAVAFFGLAGLILLRSDADPGVALAGAAAAGIASAFAVSWVMRSMSRLNLDGTLRIDRAVGASGTVYLAIPGNKAGPGKVHVTVHGRRLECRAVTAQDALPTGAAVVVVGVLNSDTLEVAPAPRAQEIEHHV